MTEAIVSALVGAAVGSFLGYLASYLLWAQQQKAETKRLRQRLTRVLQDKLSRIPPQVAQPDVAQGISTALYDPLPIVALDPLLAIAGDLEDHFLTILGNLRVALDAYNALADFTTRLSLPPDRFRIARDRVQSRLDLVIEARETLDHYIADPKGWTHVGGLRPTA